MTLAYQSRSRSMTRRSVSSSEGGWVAGGDFASESDDGSVDMDRVFGGSGEVKDRGRSSQTSKRNMYGAGRDRSNDRSARWAYGGEPDHTQSLRGGGGAVDPLRNSFHRSSNSSASTTNLERSRSSHAMLQSDFTRSRSTDGRGKQLHHHILNHSDDRSGDEDDRSLVSAGVEIARRRLHEQQQSARRLSKSQHNTNSKKSSAAGSLSLGDFLSKDRGDDSDEAAGSGDDEEDSDDDATFFSMFQWSQNEEAKKEKKKKALSSSKSVGGMSYSRAKSQPRVRVGRGSASVVGDYRTKTSFTPSHSEDELDVGGTSTSTNKRPPLLRRNTTAPVRSRDDTTDTAPPRRARYGMLDREVSARFDTFLDKIKDKEDEKRRRHVRSSSQPRKSSSRSHREGGGGGERRKKRSSKRGSERGAKDGERRRSSRREEDKRRTGEDGTTATTESRRRNSTEQDDAAVDRERRRSDRDKRRGGEEDKERRRSSTDGEKRRSSRRSSKDDDEERRPRRRSKSSRRRKSDTGETGRRESGSRRESTSSRRGESSSRRSSGSRTTSGTTKRVSSSRSSADASELADGAKRIGRLDENYETGGESECYTSQWESQGEEDDDYSDDDRNSGLLGKLHDSINDSDVILQFDPTKDGNIHQVVAKDEGTSFEIDHFDGTRSFANIKEMPWSASEASQWSALSDPITLAMTSSNDSLATDGGSERVVGVRQRLMSTGGSILRRISRAEGEPETPLSSARRSLSRSRSSVESISGYSDDDDDTLRLTTPKRSCSVSRSVLRPRSSTTDGVTDTLRSASCHTPVRKRSLFSQLTGDKSGLSVSCHSPRRTSSSSKSPKTVTRTSSVDTFGDDDDDENIDAQIEKAVNKLGLSASCHSPFKRPSSRPRILRGRSRTLDGEEQVVLANTVKKCRSKSPWRRRRRSVDE